MAANREAGGVASPCIGVCRMDPAHGLCAGCGRTLAEIAAWASASEAERRVILTRVAQRRSTAAPARADGA